MKTKIKTYINSIIEKFVKKKPEANFDSEELCINVPSLWSFSPVLEAMDIIKFHNVNAVPVVSLTNEIIGVVTEKNLAHHIAIQSVSNWSDLKDVTIDSIISDRLTTKTREAVLEEITAAFASKDVELIAIVTDEKKYTGQCITPAKMIAYTANSVKPRAIGGLATPLGVYLTDGYYNAGAGTPGLIMTGIVFAIIINVVAIFTEVFVAPHHVGDSLLLIIQLVIFLAILRISPLVGYHAAEHQTIHAIEKGIELTIENVRKQPKEHERCGTNFMILFLGLSMLFLFSMDYFKYLGFIEHTLILIVFTWLILTYWKILGNRLQKFFTTVRASDKQLLSGVRAGQQLLEYYKNNTQPVKVTLRQKILNMGIIQVLLSFLIVSTIIQALQTLLWST